MYVRYGLVFLDLLRHKFLKLDKNLTSNLRTYIRVTICYKYHGDLSTSTNALNKSYHSRKCAPYSELPYHMVQGILVNVSHGSSH